MAKGKVPPCIITKIMDDNTRSVVNSSHTLDDAMRRNPHPNGSDEGHAWSSLLRAKWAIAHKEQVLLSRKS
ncbi:MAG: hypothetical protein V3S69_03850 [Dehalococcoidales bacterium]